MRKFRCFMLAVIFLVKCFIHYAHTAGPQRRFSSRINQKRGPKVSDVNPSSLSDLLTTSRPQFPRVQQNPVQFTTTTTKNTTVKPATTRTTTVSTTAAIATTEALPAEGDAPAGIFHLNSSFFAPSTDLILDPQLLPGLASGFITILSNFRPADNQPSDRTSLKDSGPPAGRKCAVKRNGANGTCAQFDDVILGHTCVSMSTALSDQCSDGQVCCFLPTVNKATAMKYDQVPCGQRKLNVNDSAVASVPDAQIATAREFDTLSARIIGGVPAEENEICWQAAIMVDKEYSCGGAIIDSRHVITAAHCIQDIESVGQVRVRIGHRNLNIRRRCSESFEVSQIVFHDQYDPASFAFDMAVIKLAAPIINPECSCRICLPDKQGEAPSNKSCIISGYGTTQPDKLNTGGRELNIGNVNIVSDCTSRIKQDKSIPSTFVVDPSMVCAVGEDPSRLTDTCDMDAGSSLACAVSANSPNVYKLVGLASWGFPCGGNSQQSGPRVPTMYANVPHVINWIKDVQKQTEPDI